MQAQVTDLHEVIEILFGQLVGRHYLLGSSYFIRSGPQSRPSSQSIMRATFSLPWMQAPC